MTSWVTAVGRWWDEDRDGVKAEMGFSAGDWDFSCFIAASASEEAARARAVEFVSVGSERLRLWQNGVPLVPDSLPEAMVNQRRGGENVLIDSCKICKQL